MTLIPRLFGSFHLVARGQGHVAQVDGKPRITLIPHAFAISIWRRVGVVAPPPVMTGTAPE
jgi:hypothetical protein